jgi:U3 small nucleolar RNA-associated protein 6
MEAIDFAKKQKAYKKLQEMFAQVLRLHPTKSDLWINAALYAVEDNGDMTEARSYMQRGLRFCKRSRAMWLEYGRLEMSYNAKIQARRDILGITTSQPIPQRPGEDDENVIQIPQLFAIDANPEDSSYDENFLALDAIKSTPAMSGAIPIAIFDAAMAQFNDSSFGLDYFSMLLDYEHVPVCSKIASHVEASLMLSHPQDWCSEACHIQLPLVSISPTSPEFPRAFRQVLNRLKEGRKNGDRLELVKWARGWLEKLMHTEDLDPAVKRVGDSVIGMLVITASNA